MKVSVVVPVYNPGSYLDGCVESLVGQSLDPSEYEAVFVDDGSTDGTGERLDAIAAAHDNVRVVHIPNSGWPGKPRNVGIDEARGEYVQFVDQDDALTPEALERLYDLGTRGDADIVIGKVISNFRGVPHMVFRETRERCTLRDAPLIDSLTPHKMFRRSFLDANGIRYPEGKRRLEDQLFVVRAYLAAESVAILGDYVCYFYNERDDGKNAGSTRIDPPGYFANLAEILDVVEAGTEPGEFRDRLLRRFYKGEMLWRIGRIRGYSEEFRHSTYTEVRKLATTRFPRAVHDGLPASIRVRSQLVLDDRLDELMELASTYGDVRATGTLTGVRWSDGALLVSFTAGMTFRGEPLRLVRRDGRVYLDPAVTGSAVSAEARDATDDLAQVRADLLVRERDTHVEFFVPTTFRTRTYAGGPAPEGGEYVTLEVGGEATIDPRTALGGHPFDRGVWDVHMRLDIAGWVRGSRIGANRARTVRDRIPPALTVDRPNVVIPYFTKPYGNLSVDVGQRIKSLVAIAAVVRQRARARRDGARTRVEIPLHVHTTSDVPPVPCELRLSPGGWTVPANLVRESDNETVIDATVRPDPGRYELAARVGGGEPAGLGLVLTVRRHRPAYIRPAMSPRSSTPPSERLQELKARARRAARRIPALRKAVRAVRRWRAARR
ncbi:MAG: glycosyltransferase family 2 protein [Streptosporangiales bacterium]|nr:glycosyltransferase family 2 protein [Streptosporangiales bacterium]MBO0889796.1 glycosyltransferase family 2 protein [Acidothermales bacterium]